MNRINKLEEEVQELKNTLQEKENELIKLKRTLKKPGKKEKADNKEPQNASKVATHFSGLSKEAITRYSRQIILPDIGVKGQGRLCAAKVLVVGAGGLGCPASLYLAGAGIGVIGIVDHDVVDISNIHRQVLHTETDLGVNKAQSAADSLRSLNSSIVIKPYNIQVTSKNAKELICNYDLVLDCTDNVPTRYLLNDACVMCKVPLISGSALKLEGQLTIYGYRSEPADNNSPLSLPPRGPCYRCVFRTPPPPAAAPSCSAVGVAGPAPGVIGCLQAFEAIKYLVETPPDKLLVERMLIFDGEDMTFRTVKLRPRNLNCDVCSNNPKITELIDYELFCDAKAVEKDLDLHILPDENRIKAADLASKLNSKQNGGGDSNQRHLLVDVRTEQEFNMCWIDGAVNYPIEKFNDVQLKCFIDKVKEENYEVTLLCRRGNDSQIIAKRLIDNLDQNQQKKIKDLIGGLHAWAKYVDDNFPVY